MLVNFLYGTIDQLNSFPVQPGTFYSIKDTGIFLDTPDGERIQLSFACHDLTTDLFRNKTDQRISILENEVMNLKNRINQLELNGNPTDATQFYELQENACKLEAKFETLRNALHSATYC